MDRHAQALGKAGDFQRIGAVRQALGAVGEQQDRARPRGKQVQRGRQARAQVGAVVVVVDRHRGEHAPEGGGVRRRQAAGPCGRGERHQRQLRAGQIFRGGDRG